MCSWGNVLLLILSSSLVVGVVSFHFVLAPALYLRQSLLRFNFIVCPYHDGVTIFVCFDGV